VNTQLRAPSRRAALFIALVIIAQAITMFACSAAFAASVGGHVLSSSEGQGLPYAVVEVWRSSGGTWSVEATVEAGWDGSWEYDTADISPVRMRAYDPTAGHKSRWLGGSSLAEAANITPTDGSTDTSITLQFVRGATIGGSVVDEDRGYPIDRIRVTATRQGVASPVEHVQWTSDDGCFQLRNLPPGQYLVKFDDPTLTWNEQYCDYADYPEDATPVEVAGPGVYWAWAELSRHETAPAFTPAVASADTTLSPFVGTTVALETTCTDDNLGGRPRDDLPVVLYSRADGSYVRSSVPVTNAGNGRYRALIPITAAGSIEYKFAVASTDHREYAESDSCVIDAHGACRWATKTSVATSFSANPAVGDQTAITAKLVYADGQPAPGRVVRLQARVPYRQVGWVDSDVPVEDLGGGVYRAKFGIAYGLHYRLTTVEVPAPFSTASSSLHIEPNNVIGGIWNDYGSPDGKGHYLLSKGVNYGGPGVGGAWAPGLSQLTAPSAELLTTTDGINWVHSGLPVTIGASSRGGVQYTVTIPAVRQRIGYTFVSGAWGPFGERAISPEPAWLHPFAKVKSVAGPASARAGRKFTITGRVAPRLPAGAKCVVISATRSSSGSARMYRTTVSGSGSTSAFRFSLKLPRGKWTLWVSLDSLSSPTPWGAQETWQYIGGRAVSKRVVVR
jgi:hypothetical protein